MTTLPVRSVRLAGALFVALFALSAAGSAQSAPAPSSALPAIRALGAVEHKSTELFGAVSAVRALPDGRVLVNDINGRKVVLMDAALTSWSVVADTTSATANAYSSRTGGLIAFRGDSTLFVDPTSLSMLVIDPAGKVGRVMSVPRPNDAMTLTGQFGVPGFDAQGRLVYRPQPGMRMPAPAPAAGGRGGPVFAMPQFPESTAVVRIDLATRKLDTLAFLKIPKVNMSMSQDANGRMSISSITNPMPQADDWAILADGSVAILRVQDYHIEWIRPDDSRASSQKVPFAWRHLSDSDKVAYIDSARTAMEKLRADAIARMQAAGGAGNVPIMMGPPDGGGAAAMGGMRVEMRMGVEAGARGDAPRPANPDGGRGAGGPGGAPLTMPPLQLIPPNELPDYAPPFGPASSRGDMDGNLWVRTTNVVGGGSVYDVINVKGELIDRVQMPPGRVIAGFGKGGVVYMGVREGTGVRLEQARRK